MAHEVATKHTNLNEPFLIYLVDLVGFDGSTGWSSPYPHGRLPRPADVHLPALLGLWVGYQASGTSR